MVLYPSTDTELQTLAGTSRLPIVADFWASWCTGCKSLTLALTRLSPTYESRMLFRTVDVDKHPLVAGKFNIMSLPTVIILKEGEPVDRLVGSVSIKTIEAFLERHSNGHR